MPDREVCSELIRLLKIQRHDFMNHIQVIHSLLQIGKTDRVLQYIENMAIEGTSVDEFIRVHLPNCSIKEPKSLKSLLMN